MISRKKEPFKNLVRYMPYNVSAYLGFSGKWFIAKSMVKTA